MYEEEEEFHHLERKYNEAENILENLLGQLAVIKQTAPSSDIAEVAEDRIEAAQDIIEEAREELEEVQELLDDFLEQSKVATHFYEIAEANPSGENQRKAETSRSKAEKSKRKFKNKLMKAENGYANIANAIVKAKSRVNITQLNAESAAARERSKKVRINFTLPETMKHDWKDLADELSISVSQLVRNAMGVYESSIKNIPLKDMERKIEKFGEDLEERIETYVNSPEPARYDAETGERIRKQPKTKRTGTISQEEREKMKRRVTGLIRLQKSLPIPKLAKALNITEDAAENLIYELAADGIDGTLDEGEFKFSKSEMDNVVKCMCDQIDKM